MSKRSYSLLRKKRASTTFSLSSSIEERSSNVVKPPTQSLAELHAQRLKQEDKSHNLANISLQGSQPSRKISPKMAQLMAEQDKTLSFPASELALRIASMAYSQINLIDYGRQVTSEQNPKEMEPFGWRYLDMMFQRAAGKRWPEEELKKGWKPGNKDWSGIFGVFCFQLAGVTAQWSFNSDEASGSVQKVLPSDEAFNGSREAFEASIRAGDLAVSVQNNHHFIVMAANAANNQVFSIDANQEYGRILPLSSNRLSDVTAYYRAKD